MAFGKTKRQSTFTEKELEFIAIDDFTPGIHSDYHAATGKGAFPEGAAQITNTFGCVGAPNGGLIPAPRLIDSYIETQFDTTNYPANDQVVHITSFQNVPTANDLPSTPASQQFFPSADIAVNSWRTDGGASTNLFAIINVHPLSTAHWIVNATDATGYSANLGTGAYSSGGRTIQNVTITTVTDTPNTALASANIYINNVAYPNQHFGGVSTLGTSGPPYTNTFTYTVNPATGVTWTDADIIALSAGNNGISYNGLINLGGGLNFKVYQVSITITTVTQATSTHTDDGIYIFQWHQLSSSFPGVFRQKSKARVYKFWSGIVPPTQTFDIANVESTDALANLVPQASLFYGYTSTALSRSNKASPTVPGNAIFATLINPWVDNSVYSALVYPASATPTTDSTDTLVITGTSAVKLCAHQDRIVAVINSGVQAFGAKTAIGFEEIRATATNNYSIDSGQDAIFVNENPGDVGAIVSVNANELIVLKSVGGGYQARGDIGTTPTITRLPGLPPADVRHRPVSIPGGTIYGNTQGIWQFRSGDSATCLSDALDGRFWIPNNVQNYLSDVGSFAYLYPYCFVPNGFFYDMRTKGWWRLSATNNYAWAANTSEGFILLVPSYFSTGQSIADWYDPHQGQVYFSWQSQPLPITQTRLMEVQEFTLVAQPPSATVGGTVKLTFEGLNPDGTVNLQANTITLNPSITPQANTQTFYCQGYDMTVRIESQSNDGVSPAPRIYRLMMGLAEVTRSRG